MKYEWRKQEKDIYGAKPVPCVIDVPEQKYITISGEGDPNGEIFSQKVSALFSVAYNIKMLFKATDGEDKPVEDYIVYPLEGIWNKSVEGDELVKEELQYLIMIRQPDFINDKMFAAGLKRAEKKKPSPYLSDISFECIEDGKCLQILHKGSYDDEPASFEAMNRYCLENGFKRAAKEHREIYLSNPSRTDKNKLKTILRYKIVDEKEDK